MLSVKICFALFKEVEQKSLRYIKFSKLGRNCDIVVDVKEERAQRNYERTFKLLYLAPSASLRESST